MQRTTRRDRTTWFSAYAIPMSLALSLGGCQDDGSDGTNVGAGQTGEGDASGVASGGDAPGGHSGGALGTSTGETGGRVGSDTVGTGGGGGGDKTGGTTGSRGDETGGSAASAGSDSAGRAGASGTAAGGTGATAGVPERCEPLPAPDADEPSRVVTSAAELKALVEGEALEGETLFIADGTYVVEPMAVRVPHLTIRSESGHRDDVTLDLDYTPNAFDNGTIFNVWASGITIAHLTLTHAYNHSIHGTGTDAGDTTDSVLYDLHLVDNREQQVKLNADSSGQHGPRGCGGEKLVLMGFP